MKKIILLTTITSALLFSCQKNNNPSPDAKSIPGGIGSKSLQAIKTDVYIVGAFTQDGATYNAYLKNGSMVLLSPAPLGSEVFDIAVSGTNVYVVGSAEQPTGVFGAVYWKNDTLHTLKYGTALHSASEGFAATVNGNDVYFVGDYYDLDRNIVSAMLWKNDVPQNLAYNIHPSGARAVAIDHDKVYVVGYSEPDASGNTFATYWINGAHGRVRATETNSDASGMDFNRRGDLYIRGETFDTPSAVTGTYWLDGVVQMDLPDESSATNPPIPYLKNGVITYTTGIGSNLLRDVKTDGTNVYVVGQTPDGINGVYYKNGVKMPFPANFNPIKICLVQH